MSPYKNMVDQVAANKRYRQRKKSQLEELTKKVEDLEKRVAKLESEALTPMKIYESLTGT